MYVSVCVWGTCLFVYTCVEAISPFLCGPFIATTLFLKMGSLISLGLTDLAAGICLSLPISPTVVTGVCYHIPSFMRVLEILT